MLMGELAPKASRKAQVLAYIVDQLTHGGRSPSLEEISRELGVSKSRAKQLVRDLEFERRIRRVAGAQRAITVPGLERQIAIARLRADGYTVNEDFMHVDPPCTHVQLPIVAVIAHDADHDDRQQPDA